MTKNQKNKNRREIYRFYRSIGYSVKDATNMRNRGNKTVLNDLSIATKKRNKKWKKTKKQTPKIYRPSLEANKKYLSEFELKMKKYDVSDHIIEMMLEDTQTNQDLYEIRIPKLKMHFVKTDLSFDELINDVIVFDDLGEILDYIGEKYIETQESLINEVCYYCDSTKIYKYVKMKKEKEKQPVCKRCYDNKHKRKIKNA